VSGYLGSNVTTLFALGILVAVLMVRPGGLFAGARMRRV
jgi:branched-chain amino acid transport system permease protein